MVIRDSRNNNFTTQFTPSGLYHADVVEVNGNLLSIRIPKLGINTVYNNVPFTGFPPVVGARVWVTFIENQSNLPVVVSFDHSLRITEIVAGENLSGGGTAGTVTIDLDDSVALSGSLTVAGGASVGSLYSQGNASIGGTLGVAGATTLSTLNTSGNASIGGTLGVTGAASLSTLTTSGNVGVGGSMGVTGTTSLSTLSTSGSANIGGAFNAVGAASLSSLYTSGNASITGTLTSGAATMPSLNVTGTITAGHIDSVVDGPLSIAVKYIGASPITVGTPLYLTGSVGASGALEVNVADASERSKMPCIAVSQTAMTTNQEGHATVKGVLRDLNTAGFAINDTLYVSHTGTLTNVRPSITTPVGQTTPAPYYNQHIGRVIRVHASTGQILVNTLAEIEYEQVISIVDYITDDGITDNRAAVQLAINESPVGAVIDFRGLQNHLRVSGPLYFKERRTYLFANNAGMWPYRQVNAGVSVFTGGIKALSTFTGEAVVIIEDVAPYNTAGDTDTITVMGMAVDVSAVTTGNVTGVLVRGLVRDLKFTDCSVYSSKGTGKGWFFTSNVNGSPRGIRMNRCVADNSATSGFRFDATTDFAFHDLLASNCTNEGFYHSSPGAGVYVNCTSGFNQIGFKVEKFSRLGQISFIGCLTDRNARQGMLISETWTGGADVPPTTPAHTILLSGCQFRRDGYDRVANPATSIGIHISGTSATYQAAPVDIVGCQVVVERGDNPGDGTAKNDQYSPLAALRVVHAERVTVVGGFYWGETSASVSNGSCAVTLGGTNTVVEWTPQTYFARTTTVGATRTRDRDPNVPSVVGALPLSIVQGGTGASTVALARSSFGGAPASAQYVVATDSAELTSDYPLGSSVIMAGSLAPAANLNGRMFFNSQASIGVLYRDSGTAWSKVAGPVNSIRFLDYLNPVTPASVAAFSDFSDAKILTGIQAVVFPYANNATFRGLGFLDLSVHTYKFTTGVISVQLSLEGVTTTSQTRQPSTFGLTIGHNPQGWYLNAVDVWTQHPTVRSSKDGIGLWCWQSGSPAVGTIYVSYTVVGW